MKTSAAKFLYAAILAAVLPALNAQTPSRSYSAGTQYLSINGVACPELVSWSGGDASAKVVVEAAAGPGAAAKKHIGNPAYEPIIVEVALPLSPALQNSLSDLCANKTSTLTLLLTNANGTQVQANHAQLIEARFPALDATSRNNWRLTLVFRADSTHPVSGGSAGPAGPRPRSASISSFRFTLGGITGNPIAGIEAFTITRAVPAGVGAERDYSATPGSTQIPDLSVTIVQTGAAAWAAWRDDFIVQGNSDDAKEKNGTLEILASDLSKVLLALQLSHVGIKRLEQLPGADGRPDKFRVGLYCEEISVANVPVAGATTPASTTETPAATPAPAPATPPAEAAPADTTTPAPTTPAEAAPADAKTPAPADTKTPAQEPTKTPETAPAETTPAPAANSEAASKDKGPRDPADFPRAKDTTRTQYSAVREKGFVQETANYTAKAKSDDLMAFYEKELKGRGWEESARYENDNGTDRAHQIQTTWKKDIRTVSMTFMDTASGNVEIQVVLQERK
jgi:hypothetical protein